MKVKITLLEEVLGSSPSNEELLATYIASKAPTGDLSAEEVDNIKAQNAEDRVTVFPKTADGTPFLYDYQVKGMFKDSCKMLAKAGKAGYAGGKACAAIKAYKQAIDGLIFVTPREIPYDLHGMKVDFCERPLRAQTPMGERVSIAKSESIPAGATAEFEIECLDPKLEDMVRECLDYGTKRGLGQWRNSGKGHRDGRKTEHHKKLLLYSITSPRCRQVSDHRRFGAAAGRAWPSQHPRHRLHGAGPQRPVRAVFQGGIPP